MGRLKRLTQLTAVLALCTLLFYGVVPHVLAGEDGHTTTIVWSNENVFTTDHPKDVVVAPLAGEDIMVKVLDLLGSGLKVFLLLNCDSSIVSLSSKDIESIVKETNGEAYQVHPYTKLPMIPTPEVTNEEAHLETVLEDLNFRERIRSLEKDFKIEFTNSRIPTPVVVSNPETVVKEKCPPQAGSLVVADVTPASLRSAEGRGAQPLGPELTSELKENIKQLLPKALSSDGPVPAGCPETKQRVAALLVSVPVDKLSSGQPLPSGGVRSSPVSEHGASSASSVPIVEGSGARSEVEVASEDGVDREVLNRLLQGDGNENDTDDTTATEALLNITEFSMEVILLLLTATFVVLSGLCCLHSIDPPASFVEKPLVIGIQDQLRR